MEEMRKAWEEEQKIKADRKAALHKEELDEKVKNDKALEVMKA